MGEIIIRAKNLSFAYGKKLLIENLSFEVERKDYIGIVGANGSAKSTLLKLIMGILKPIEGQISIFGSTINNFNDWNRIGYLPQNARDFNVRFPATVEEIIGSSQYSKMGLFKILNKEIKDNITPLLESVGMLAYRKSLIGKLSGGQQQRILLAKLLANNPEVIIMDEPLIGVDLESQETFLDVIDKLNKDYQITIIMVTHDINSIKNRANKVFHLSNGELNIERLGNRF